MNSVVHAGFYNKKLITEPHIHNYVEMLCLTKGTIGLSVANKRYTIHAPALYILMPMEEHSITCYSNDYERYVLFLDITNYEPLCQVPTLLSIFKLRPNNFNHVFENLPLSFLVHIKSLTDEFSHGDNCSYHNILYNSIITELLIQLYRHYPIHFTSQPINKNMLAIQSYLDEHYMENPKIEDVARLFYINPYYMTHSFKEYTGYSPKQYLTHIQFLNARRLLLTTKDKIGEIAETTGFETLNDFTRRFKKEFKITPKQYRLDSDSNPFV